MDALEASSAKALSGAKAGEARGYAAVIRSTARETDFLVAWPQETRQPSPAVNLKLARRNLPVAAHSPDELACP
jgi:hypothetical protein